MSFSRETEQKINQFAKEQSRHYLDAAEITYLEKLRGKTSQAKQKAGKKLARFKVRSDQSHEAQNDMILYMSDYMSDLMSKGLSEQEAFEKAQAELSASADSGAHTGLQEHYGQYYRSWDPQDYEVIGLLYGGFTTIGLAVGGLIAFLVSGGVPAFLQHGWIYTIAGAGAGAVFGVGCGEIAHAVIVKAKKK